MAKYIAALDQGTTSTRFILFNSSAEIVASSQMEHQQIYPKPGWVEHDPIEIVENTLSVIKNTLNTSGIKVKDIAGLGITNQRETTVVWSRTNGQPVYNAIVWQDTRTDEICRELEKEDGQDRFRSRVGLPISTYFSGPKIRWILEHVQGSSKSMNKNDLLFGTIDSWLVWNLTGGVDNGQHITDVTNASRTMLMDLNTLSWDEEIVKIMGVPISSLPEIRSSSEIFGTCVDPLPGVPIGGILGDQQAALFGQTCFSAGDAKNTYGTGCFLLQNSGNKPIISSHGLLTTLAYQIGSDDPVYALEGSVAIAGALVQWLRDNLGLIESSSEIEDLAREVEDNGGIYFVPAFSGLFAPYWQSDARGVMTGLTRYVTKAHIARATLEATAFQTKEILEAMENDSGIKLTTLKVDGGMVQNELLMQFQADVLNVPVVRPTITETTALGAAYAAGLAINYWKDEEEIRTNWNEDRIWRPNMSEDDRNQMYKMWKKAVTRSFDWLE